MAVARGWWHWAVSISWVQSFSWGRWKSFRDGGGDGCTIYLMPLTYTLKNGLNINKSKKGNSDDCSTSDLRETRVPNEKESQRVQKGIYYVNVCPSWITALSWRRGLHNSMKLWAMLCRATQDERVIAESSDKTWSAGRGNGKPPQYICYENLMNCIKGQKRSLDQDLRPFLKF